LATIQINLTCELQEAVKVRYLDGNLFSQDNQGNQINITVFDNGEPATLGGSVTANVLLSDGSTVPATGGTITGNVVSITLPAAAYAVPGLASIIVKLTADGVITTIAAVVANVYQSSTDTVIDPGTIIPSIQDLIDDIADAVATIPADYSTLWTTLAPAYSNTATYPVGQYVTYNGGLYRCTTQVTTAGDWSSNSGNFTAAVICTDLFDLKQSISPLSPFDLIYQRNYNKTTSNGITFTWDSVKGMWHAAAQQATGNGFVWMSGNRFKVQASHKYWLVFNVDGATDLWAQVYAYTQESGGSSSTIAEIQGGGYAQFETNADTVAIRVRLRGVSGSAYDVNANAYITEMQPNDLVYREALTTGSSLPSCDLNTVVQINKEFIMLSGATYTNKPAEMTSNAGYLICYRVSDSWTLQVLYEFNGYKCWKRGLRSGEYPSVEDWKLISTGEIINNNNTYVENTYNVTATPTITTDTNQYLASTGDDTDVTTSIQTMLVTYGVCRLGPGDFYVTGIDMPAGSAIYGCGFKSRIRLIGTQNTTGYAIKVNENCEVSNVQICGSDANGITLSSTIKDRHGILFEGHSADDPSQWSYTYHRTIISNCWIRNFHGSGIKCNNTGYNTNACLMVANVWIYYCNCGLYIPYFSEFNRFNGLHCNTCYFGCINNGGNNVFVNCNFSSNTNGFIMDNTDGNARNNSHGSVVGCVFDHSGNNEGIGIKLVGMTNGEVFSDCQVFYSDIIVENCSGIQFNNFNIGGESVDITIKDGTDGGVIVFNGCIFKAGSYTIDLTDANNKAKFINCFLRDGTPVSPT
jgi:hypothetical protein